MKSKGILEENRMKDLLGAKIIFVSAILISFRIFNIGYRLALRLIFGGKIRRDRIFSKYRLNDVPHKIFEKLMNILINIKTPWGKFLTGIDRLPVLPPIQEPEIPPYLSILEKGDIAIDVGAHHGWYTVLFAKKIGLSGKVVAIEPHPKNISILRHNIEQNHIAKQVVIVQAALSDKYGTADLYLGHNIGVHSIVSNRRRGSLRVGTIPLDAVLEKYDKVKLLKMDIEGAEKIVLSSSRLLKKVRRYIVETHSFQNMVFIYNMFHEQEFEVKALNDHRIVADSIG